MCGIVGQFEKNGYVSEEMFRSMCEAIRHRGPDDAGIYRNPSKDLMLGHLRLSFLDLTPNGHQPMTDVTDRVVITYNGEVYNYPELKQQLSAGYEFRSNSDTEVIIAGYLKWGIGVVNHLKGMFAFGLYDRDKNKMFLVRDRFGIKPLYYLLNSERLVFASELKAILRSGRLKRDLDITAMADFFVYRYVPSPKTIWKDARKIPPAHYMEVDLSTMETTSLEYWKLGFADKAASGTELVERVDGLLTASVRQHMLADVPIGSFLSGGYDSSAMVYYAKKNGYLPKTFSIGFKDWENSEHRYARIVADHLGVENEAVVADARDLDLMEQMPHVYDEPLADISIIPTFMVSRLARTTVKAVLSGEGADELFGGYTWQREFYQLMHPASFRERMKLMFSQPDTVGFYAESMAMGRFAEKELKRLFNADLHAMLPNDPDWFYRQHFDPRLSPLKSIQKMDVKCFMGELVLTKIDRASMANSLEVRVPFLDHELFDCVFGHSEKTYFRPSVTKYILNENLKAHLPQEIMNRKKQGFVGPDSYYMDIDWYRKQLFDGAFLSSGLINPDYVDELFNTSDHWRLWKLTVMSKWYDTYMGQ